MYVTMAATTKVTRKITTMFSSKVQIFIV
jgi:hypothetical protein